MPLIGRDKLKLTEKAMEIANRDVRGVFKAGLANIVEGTPVDSGRARNAWVLTSGKFPKWILNKSIRFVNNVDYIETLEYGGYPNPSKGNKTSGGFSKQAPNGWVRKILKAMENKIRSLK